MQLRHQKSVPPYSASLPSSSELSPASSIGAPSLKDDGVAAEAKAGAGGTNGFDGSAGLPEGILACNDDATGTLVKYTCASHQLRSVVE